ncbi:MAG: FixH family protein [Phycisphaerales bacterium]
MQASEPTNVRTGRSWVWPLAVVGALAVSLTVCAITVVAAVSDPSYAIEDDYYQKAVDWDDRRALQAASDQLGWNANVSIDLAATTLAVAINDDQGQPIEAAIVRATIFHHARRGMAQRVDLRHEGQGCYTATIAQPREGQWQVRLTAQHNSNTFILNEDLYARRAPVSEPRTP